MREEKKVGDGEKEGSERKGEGDGRRVERRRERR